MEIRVGALKDEDAERGQRTCYQRDWDDAQLHACSLCRQPEAQR